MTLVPGERYLCGLAPWGVLTVMYLGQVRLLRGWSRVKVLCGTIENVVSGRVIRVKTETIKPMLISVHGGGGTQ